MIVYLDSLVSSIGFLFSNISAEDNQYNNIQHLALVTTDYIALVTTDHIALVTTGYIALVTTDHIALVTISEG